MNFIKNKFKELLYISIIFLIINLIYTILIYFSVFDFSSNTIRTITYITGLILFLLYGTISGMTERKNGWLAGLSSALIIIIATLFINILIKTPINLLFFIKVISYIISGIVGGMIGVNFKK